MSGFRKPGLPTPNRYKFIINEEYAGRDKQFGSDFTYNDLLLMQGPDAKDYVDITQVAKKFYSSYSQSLSTDLNPLYDMVAASGGIQDIDKNYIRWKVYGEPEREIISYGNPNASVDSGYYGANGFSFSILLDEENLKVGDRVAPLKNKSAIVKIEEEATPAGGAWEYKGSLIDRDRVFPEAYFKPGDYWIKLAPQTSWLDSGEAGSLNFGFRYSYVEFEVPMNTSQWEFTVDEESLLAYPSISIHKYDGQINKTPVAKSLTNLLETEAMMQIKREKELTCVYGRSTKDLVDSVSGQAITNGPGLMEFAEQCQEIPYSPTMKGLGKVVEEIRAFWYDKVPPANRKLQLNVGEPVLDLFHKWILAEYKDAFVMSTEDLILGDSTPWEAGRNGKSFNKLQFTKYLIPSFGEITLAHWALLDNTRINPIKMPGTIYPITAFEMWAFDTGFGEPNIQMFTRSNKERTVIIPGMMSPFGPVGINNPYFKHPTDPNLSGYKWRHRSSYGLVVMEPDRMLRFIPQVR